MSSTAEHLLDALREYAAGAPTSAGLDVDPEDAAEELIALGKAIGVLDSALAGAMARYDRLNAGSPAAILVQHAGLTRTHAANLRRLGRKLEADLPATREKLASGQIGTAPARTIADLDEQLASADTPMPQEARRQVEEALADYAAGATTTEVTRAARDARYRLTPEPAEREMKDQHESRGITLAKTYGGQTHIAGTADPVTTATILGYLDRNAGRLGPEDTRTAAARRLDALADAVTLAQRITTPDAGPSRANRDAPAVPDRDALQKSCSPPPTAPGGCPPRERGDAAVVADGDALQDSGGPPTAPLGRPPRSPATRLPLPTAMRCRIPAACPRRRPGARPGSLVMRLSRPTGMRCRIPAARPPRRPGARPASAAMRPWSPMAMRCRIPAARRRRRAGARPGGPVR